MTAWESSFSFLVHAIRKGRLQALRSKLDRTSRRPDDQTKLKHEPYLSPLRRLMCHNRFIRWLIWRTNQTAEWRELTIISSTFILSIFFFHLMKKKRENMVTQQKQRRENLKNFLEKIAELISIQGLHSIYRWRRSWTTSNSIFQSPKVGPRP